MKSGFAVLALATLLCVMPFAKAQNKVVHVYNWAEYAAEDTIPGFERETGIKVRYDTYDNNETLQSRLVGGKSGYDVVVPSTHYASRQIDAGLFQKLDKSKIPNYKYLDPDIMALLSSVDPGNQYLVPWGYGTNGLGYNVTKARQALGDRADLSSWSNLFDPARAEKLQSCGISILDEASQVFPAVLFYLGKDPNSSNPDDYKSAYELLKTIRPYVRQFSSSSYIDDLASGNLCMVYGYSGDILIARRKARESKRSDEIDYFLPKGGAPAWFDTMAIPKDAQNVDAAHAFINYIETPRVHAEIANKMFYPNANKSSRKLLSPEVANNPMIYPPPDVSKTLFVIRAQPLNIQRLQAQLWSDLKSGR